MFVYDMTKNVFHSKAWLHLVFTFFYLICQFVLSAEREMRKEGKLKLFFRIYSVYNNFCSQFFPP